MKKRTICSRTTDLSALVSDIRKLGPEAALPNKLPQKWLLSIARDVVMARQLEQVRPEDDDSPGELLTPIIAMIVMLLGEQNTPVVPIAKFPQMSFEEAEFFEYVEIYKFLVLEELAARTTGVKAGSYTLKSIFHPELIHL